MAYFTLLGIQCVEVDWSCCNLMVALLPELFTLEALIFENQSSLGNILMSYEHLI